jgi:hypothetical protein
VHTSVMTGTATQYPSSRFRHSMSVPWNKREDVQQAYKLQKEAGIRVCPPRAL